MPVIDFNRHRDERAISRFLELRRPPPEIRDEVDLECRFDGRKLEIVEVRAAWKDRSLKVERPVAKATYVAAAGHWRVFWLGRQGRWQKYGLEPEVPSVEAFLDLVHRDEDSCFFG